jgi:hypothetical protein
VPGKGRARRSWGNWGVKPAWAGHGLIMGSRIAACHQSDDSLCRAGIGHQDISDTSSGNNPRPNSLSLFIEQIYEIMEISVRPAGFESATRCLEGTCEASRYVAWDRSMRRLAGRIVWACRPALLSICRRWLPEWLPETCRQGRPWRVPHPPDENWPAQLKGTARHPNRRLRQATRNPRADSRAADSAPLSRFLTR